MKMIELVLGLSASFFLALGIVEARRGLENSHYEACILIITVVGFIIFVPVTFLTTDFNKINFEGSLMFLLAGILNPGLSRIFFYKSVEKVGAVLTSSITPSSPIISAIFAVIILNEEPWIGLWLSIACIVVGSILIEIGSHGKNFNIKTGTWLILPVLASLATGLNDVVRKQALTLLSQPLFGTTLAYVATLSLYMTAFSLTGKISSLISRNNFKLFWKSGIFLALGQLSSFHALNFGKVLTVAPLIYTQPLFVFFLTITTLKKIENMTWKPLIGSIVMILGIILLSIR
ncbi:MAG: DMT family transporter [Nitrososphaeria archaeon]|nr:DMT family transporter [Nitrososphaeria archaeon]